MASLSTLNNDDQFVDTDAKKWNESTKRGSAAFDRKLLDRQAFVRHNVWSTCLLICSTVVASFFLKRMFVVQLSVGQMVYRVKDAEPNKFVSTSFQKKCQWRNDKKELDESQIFKNVYNSSPALFCNRTNGRKLLRIFFLLFALPLIREAARTTIARRCLYQIIRFWTVVKQ